MGVHRVSCFFVPMWCATSLTRKRFNSIQDGIVRGAFSPPLAALFLGAFPYVNCRVLEWLFLAELSV